MKITLDKNVITIEVEGADATPALNSERIAGALIWGIVETISNQFKLLITSSTCQNVGAMSIKVGNNDPVRWELCHTNR